MDWTARLLAVPVTAGAIHRGGAVSGVSSHVGIRLCYCRVSHNATKWDSG